MKFVGHLDIMRYFQKAIRRAGIDIAYSEGYSPHQIMSFAAPLGVGITSEGEYFDIEVKSSMSSEASVRALNEVMVEGIQILEYKKMPDTAKTSMSLVAAADYLIYGREGYQLLPNTFQELQDKVQTFYEEQKQICIAKQTKKQQIEMDLKPLIYEMKVLNTMETGMFQELPANRPAIFLKTCTGSSSNVKPELILEAFCQFHGLPYASIAFQIHRLEVYAKADEIPVKGEKERERYQAYLKQQKKQYRQEGKEFPRFITLGELGEDLK